MMSAIAKMLSVLLIAVGLVSGAMPVLAEDGSGEIILGELNYSTLGMEFKPIANQTISTNADSALINVTINDKLSLASFLNTVEIGIIAPSGEQVSFSITELPLKLNTAAEGNYTVIIAYGGWVPLVGGLYEILTGSGSYTFTIVKEAPFDITPFLIIAGIIGAIIVVVAIVRRKRKVSVLRP